MPGLQSLPGHFPSFEFGAHNRLSSGGPPSGSVLEAATALEAGGRNNLTLGGNLKSEGEFEDSKLRRSKG